MTWYDRNYYVEQHCLAEARREVECWFSGEMYLWRPYVPHWTHTVEPLDCFVEVR